MNIINLDNNDSNTININDNSTLYLETSPITTDEPKVLISFPITDKCTVYENPNAVDKIIYDENYKPDCIEKRQKLFVLKYNNEGEPAIVIGPHCIIKFKI